MVFLTRSGKRPKGLNIRFYLSVFLFAFLFAIPSPAQGPLGCATTSTNLTVRVEGLAEPMGAIALNCSGGVPGTQVATNITVTLPTPITNRLSAAGVPDAVLTVDTGSGPAPSGNPVFLGSNVLAFNGVSFTLPATGRVTIEITNLRASLSQAQPGQLIVASLSTTGLSINNPNPIVATAQRGLLATYASKGITCVASPLPSEVNIANLFAAGTAFTSTRVTEGFAGAFAPKLTSPAADAGTRIVVKYSGFPAGAQLYVPSLVAGNNAVQPTAGGDLGGQQSGGIYMRGATPSLLLTIVEGADANGAGGSLRYVAGAFPGQTPITLNGVSQVSLTGGAGIAVYEVIGSDPSAVESAQFPVFLGLVAPPNQTPVIAGDAVSLGPVSTVAVATAGDPVPRFVGSAPPSDCQLLGDCGAAYFPALTVDTASLNFTAPAGGIFQTQFVRVNNTGGGFLSFTASLTFQSGGTGWLIVDPPSGANNATLRVVANFVGLSAGTYGATLKIDAGAAGSRSIPVSLTVTAPVIPPITVSSVTNAATFLPGPLVAGSLATIKGANFATSNVSVTFDGVPAPLLYTSPTQINLQVPAALAGQAKTQLVVMVDGRLSVPQAVQLASVAPGIFGVLNQDSSLNAAGNPSRGGQVIQIFATGLMSSGTGPVTVNIQGQNGLIPLYAGVAPGLTGVQQVNVAVPSGLPAAASVSVCGVGTDSSQAICSPAVTIAFQ